MPESTDAGCVNCADDRLIGAPGDLITTGRLLRENAWISRFKLEELLDGNVIPFYRFGGVGSRRYVSRADWAAYVQQHRQEPTQ